MFPYLDMSEKGMVMLLRDGHVFVQDLKTLGWCPVGSVYLIGRMCLFISLGSPPF